MAPIAIAIVHFQIATMRANAKLQGGFPLDFHPAYIFKGFVLIGAAPLVAALTSIGADFAKQG
jgi:hypothetical protein